MKLIIYSRVCRPRQATLSLLIAILILIKLPILKIIFNRTFFARHIHLYFCDTILFFSVLTLKYLILLRCYARRRYVEIQMAQELVVIEKMVKMRELLKQSLQYFISTFSLHFKLSFVKKGGGGQYPGGPPT